ncbi:DNA-binding response regulator [Rhizobium vallis]|uniref:DNA-binding response regulator n=1 Tax=Rhizobium vallis TaxID=634290 RepID=A0A432PN89_9HYPH|nr:DNA-binding response regulator [Rhizobium vallis]
MVAPKLDGSANLNDVADSKLTASRSGHEVHENRGLLNRSRKQLMVARGRSDKDIAWVLATVRTHVGSCLAKLECSNRAEVAAQVSKLSH